MSTATLAEQLHRTDQVNTAQRRVVEVAHERRLLAIIGPTGAGKSAASRAAVEHAAAKLDRRAAYVLVPRRPTAAEFTSRVIEALTGEPSPRLAGHRLDDHLLRLLDERESIILIDEAQRIGLPVFDQLQYLWETRRTCMVLVATPEFERFLANAVTLDSRTDKLQFIRPADDDLRNVLAVMHPAFATAPPSIVRSLNRRFDSNLHKWRRCAEKIDYFATHYEIEPVLDEEMVEVLLREMA